MRRAVLLATAGLAVAATSDQAVLKTLDQIKQEATKIDAALKAKLHHTSPPSLPPRPDDDSLNNVSPNANELSRWVVKPVSAGPGRTDTVDWSRIVDRDQDVTIIDWHATSTPEVGHLQPGTSNATEAGKAYGTSRASYADSRFGTDFWDAARPVGRLLFNIGTTTYACSATLIGKSLLLTAAHCVFNYGANRGTGFYTNFRFYPQLSSNAEPFGFWPWRAAMVPSVFYSGTDTCVTRGVVCNNDLAVIWLESNGSTIANQAGVAVGYYPYGWNGYSFVTPTSTFTPIFGAKPYVAITQLGYPVAHDAGRTMQIANSPGFQYTTTSTGNGKRLLNLMRGTSLTGGSSGGPWVANFGVNAVLSGTTQSSAAGRNTIVAVTSWGYTDGGIKVQGASWFGQNAEFTLSAYGSRGAGNIGKLVYDACDNAAISGWQLQGKGFCT